MKKIFLLCLITFLFVSCDRTKKIREINKQTTEEKLKKVKYLEIYASHYDVKKGSNGYIIDATINVANKTNKKIYWFKVLVNIYENGKLTHSIVYTPNYYMEKDGKNYYHVLGPKQNGIFRIYIGDNYNIKNYPTNVTFSIFEVGDSIEIFKKVRANPKKYFIPYTPK